MRDQSYLSSLSSPQAMQKAIEANKALTPQRSAELDTIIKDLSSRLVKDPNSARPEMRYSSAFDLSRASPEYLKDYNAYQEATIERYGQKKEGPMGLLSLLPALGVALGPALLGAGALSGSQGASTLVGKAAADTLGAGAVSSAATGAAAPSFASQVGSALSGIAKAPFSIAKSLIGGITGGGSGVKELGDAMPWLSGASTAANTGSSVANFLSNPSISSFSNILSANKNLIGPVAGLALAASRGDSSTADLLRPSADWTKKLADQFTQYFDTGKLPPGAQAGIDRATMAAKAAIRSNYASRGMSGSSAEAQDLADADRAAMAQGFESAVSLVGQGINANNNAAGLYKQIMQQEMQEDEDLISALVTFGTSLFG